MNGSMSKQKAAWLVAVIPAGIVLIVAAVLLVAPAAHAAPAATSAAQTHPVQFSNDGIHWSNSYTDALFGGVVLVPGGSADRSFFVKNGANGQLVRLRDERLIAYTRCYFCVDDLDGLDRVAAG